MQQLKSVAMKSDEKLSSLKSIMSKNNDKLQAMAMKRALNEDEASKLCKMTIKLYSLEVTLAKKEVEIKELHNKITELRNSNDRLEHYLDARNPEDGIGRDALIVDAVNGMVRVGPMCQDTPHSSPVSRRYQKTEKSVDMLLRLPAKMLRKVTQYSRRSIGTEQLPLLDEDIRIRTPDRTSENPRPRSMKRRSSNTNEFV